MPKAIAFYQQVAGLRLGRRFGSLGVELLGGSSVIYLIVKPDGSAALAVSRTGPARDAAMLGADAGRELKAKAGPAFFALP